MPSERGQSVLRHLRRAVEGDGDGVADAELLECFLARRDEDAFGALVRRHGAMVLGVCRRVLRHTQDAEDACQATFLLLARKAAAVRQREALGGWLYRVARHVALKVRSDAARRSARDGGAVVRCLADAAEEVTWREALAVLDEELSRLPAAYRAALVLCYLEGQTQDEAARQLGWSLGALRGRLERGRAKLRARLSRRGVGLPAALLGVALGQGEASAAVLLVSASNLVRAARQLAAGEEAAMPAHIASWAEEGAEGMLTAKVTVGAGVLLAGGLVAAGVALTARQAVPANPPARFAAPPPADSPKPGAKEAQRMDLHGDPLP